jgi:hypothetical protein
MSNFAVYMRPPRPAEGANSLSFALEVGTVVTFVRCPNTFSGAHTGTTRGPLSQPIATKARPGPAGRGRVRRTACPELRSWMYHPGPADRARVRLSTCPDLRSWIFKKAPTQAGRRVTARTAALSAMPAWVLTRRCAWASVIQRVRLSRTDGLARPVSARRAGLRVLLVGSFAGRSPAHRLPGLAAGSDVDAASRGGYFITRMVFRLGSAGSGSVIPASSPLRR